MLNNIWCKFDFTDLIQPIDLIDTIKNIWFLKNCVGIFIVVWFTNTFLFMFNLITLS